MGERRRIVHVVYNFAIGGLENVIVQLINGLPADEFEHVVVSLTGISDLKRRIVRHDVRFIALGKKPGHAVALYPRITRLLRELEPDVLHTCNLAALEIVPLGWLARVPLRIHAEHGWDAHDPDGSNPRYRLLRRCYRPFVSHYISVSQDLDRYLGDAVGVPAARRSLIANGVDTRRFAPATPATRGGAALAGCPFTPGQHWLIGTVGRLQSVKNQPLLARAFVRLVREHPQARDCLRLLIIGEGPLRGETEAILAAAGCLALSWLPGARDDVAQIMQRLDCFVLPSQAEGTSCTLQEAMACALPVVATAVGGTPQLVDEGVTGYLVPADDEAAMADAIWKLYSDPLAAKRQGQSARRRAVESFALAGMIARYRALFLSERGA
ncbi:MAG: glycosyl transferase 4-like domain protein [Proteobacteria bacterium]|nr:glycosyl transferase 4-like domain protein [Pseudomonadota bacterium]